MRRPGPTRVLVAFTLVLLPLAVTARDAAAQATTATINGTVRDNTGAVLPGASITTRNLETGLTRTVVSDGQGRFRAANLPIGSYDVRAELAGFRSEARSGITLTVGSETVLDFVLSVGELAETVTVTGEAPLVDTSKSEVSGLVDDKRIRDLPLNGRTFSQLALLQPNVHAFQQTRPGFFAGRTPKITIGGGRFYYNSFLLDGTDVNDVYNNTPGSVAGVFLGVEAVREFKVMTHNMNAEYGRSAGGIINAVTKSGTNELHGAIFEFHRNSALDARNFFDRSDPPPFRRNQFGGTLGGPIARNKAFFFGAYEGLRESLSSTKVGFVPSVSARSGGLGPVHAAALPILSSYPAPNGRDLGGGVAEYIFVFQQPSREDFAQIRIDHNFSENSSIFARYTFDDADVTRLTFDLPGFQEPEESRRQYLTIEERQIFSPNVLSTLRLGFNSSFDAVEDVPVPGGTVPPPVVPFHGFRTLQVGGLTSFGTDFRLPITDDLKLFEASEDLTVNKGANSLKFGANVKRFHYDIFQDAFQGILVFPSVLQLVQGTPALLVAQFPGADVFRSMRQWMFAFYGQDDLRLGSNVTVNLGLRYEFATVPTETEDRFTAFLSPFDPASTAVDGVFENPTLRNFAPRAGVAWDPFGDKKTVVRTGLGIFHDPFISYHFRPTLNLQHPRWRVVERPSPPFPDVLQGLTDTNTAFGLFAHEFTPKNPYMVHYNLSFERELFPQTAVMIGYVGSRGMHLPGLVDANSAIPQFQPDGRPFFPLDAPRRNPRFGFMRVKVHDNQSFYNALVASVNRRFHRGLQFQVSYTLGKSIDDTSQINTSESIGTLPERMFTEDRKLDRGLSIHDIRHNLVINYSYEVPSGNGARSGIVAQLTRGWQINGITTVRSGNPFTLYMRLNRSGSRVVGSGGVFVDRPNLKPGASNNPINPQNPNQYFDPSAFSFPDAGFLGDLGRNTLIGPGLVTFDVSLVKHVAIAVLGEESAVQFKIEMFNLFNRANFGLPENVIFGPGGALIPTAGRITTTTTTARQIQLAAKVLF